MYLNVFYLYFKLTSELFTYWETMSKLSMAIYWKIAFVLAVSDVAYWKHILHFGTSKLGNKLARLQVRENKSISP